MESFKDLVMICKDRIAFAMRDNSIWNMDRLDSLSMLLDQVNHNNVDSGVGIQGNTDIEVAGLRESLVGIYRRTKLENAILGILDSLVWKPFSDHNDATEEIMTCDLIGPNDNEAAFATSSTIQLGLMVIPMGVTLPVHGDETSCLYHILQCDNEAKAGAAEDLMEEVLIGESLHFPPGAPKTFQAGLECPVLMVFLKVGDIKNCQPTWFNDPQIGEPYAEEFSSPTNNQNFYNVMANEYEEVMRNWGYYAPNVIAQAIMEHRDIFDRSREDVRFLDLGCGTGLCASVLKKHGFEKFIGVDVAQAMLDQAKTKGIYKKLKQLDLMDRLPYQDNLFDCALAGGVTNHLKPKVLDDWLRVVKVGGLLVLSHQSSHWEEWELVHLEMEEKKLWKRLWVSEPPMLHLPGLRSKKNNFAPNEERFKVYVYQKL